MPTPAPRWVSLYFALAGILPFLHYLQHGLSAILVFIGAKMLLEHYYKVPVETSLAVVGGVLAVSVTASLVRARFNGGDAPSAGGGTPPADEHDPKEPR